MLFCHKINYIWMINALLSQNLVVEIYALFPPIFLVWQILSAIFCCFLDVWFQAFHRYKILSSFKTVDYNCKNVRTEQKWKRWMAKKRAPIFSLGQAQILATWSSGLRGFCGAFIVPLFADWTAQVQLKWAWSGPFLQPFGAKWSQSFRQHYRFIPYKMLPKNAI